MAQCALASLEVPGSPVVVEFMELSGVDRRTVSGSIQDPGSTRMQLQVRDLDAAIQAVVRAGGSVISTGGKPVELPAGRGASIRAAMVRAPDNLFLVLIESRPAAVASHALIGGSVEGTPLALSCIRRVAHGNL